MRLIIINTGAYVNPTFTILQYQKSADSDKNYDLDIIYID
jgi:hypothetical protein